MDTVKSLKENLKYQRENFKNIYESYYDYVKINNFAHNAKDEIAITKSQKERENKIVILLDNFNGILEELFNISEVMLKKALKDVEGNNYFIIDEYMDNIDTLIIKKTYNDLQVNIAEYKMEIKCVCSYKLKDNIIVLLKENITKSTLKNVNSIFALRKVTSFEKRNLKEKLHKFKEVNNIEELKEELLKMKITHNEAFYINKLNEKVKPKEEINKSIFINQYKCSLALDIIDAIIKNRILEETIQKIVTFINEKILNYYNGEMTNLMKIYLKDNFFDNFIIVNCILKEKEIFYKKINNILINKIYKEVEGIKDLDSVAEENIALMNSSIVSIDELIGKSIETLNNLINVTS